MSEFEVKTCRQRQLLSVVLVFTCSCVTLGVDSPISPKAVLHATGKVQVNGSGSRRITTLFPGDSIQTDEDSVADITVSGSSVLVMPKASVKFLGNAMEVDEGGVTIATSVGLSARVEGLTITPASEKLSKFEVTDNEDSVVVAALQGNVAVSDGQQSSTTQEGQETTHAKKQKGTVGAQPAASGTHEVPVKTIALASGAVAAVAAGILIAERGNDRKRCVSPSGDKKCKCRKDSKGRDDCRITE